MKLGLSIRAISLAMTLGLATYASASDVEDGRKLYVLQCEKCHGAMYGEETGALEPLDSSRQIQLAMLDSLTPGTALLIRRIIPAPSSIMTPLASMPTGERLAVALPNGPPLRGIVGRPAASIEGYKYSKSALKILKGVVWSETELDRWITNSQAWVPGSFMYYKQDDPETRRKIIAYLKSNP